VPGLDECDFVARAIERPEYAVDAIAGVTKNPPNAPQVQALNNEIANCLAHLCAPGSSIARRRAAWPRLRVQCPSSIEIVSIQLQSGPCALNRGKSEHNGKGALRFTHQVVDLIEELGCAIWLSNKAAVIRDLGIARPCLTRRDYKQHVRPPGMHLSRQVIPFSAPGISMSVNSNRTSG
jgi:hypothetical protein